jgi:hypothetical protein
MKHKHYFRLDARREYKERHYITFGLSREPIKVSCNHCGKIILSDMEWVCGYCDAENASTNLYSFLNKCEVCKQPPKCVECPHCNKLNFLINSRDTLNGWTFGEKRSNFVQEPPPPSQFTTEP